MGEWAPLPVRDKIEIEKLETSLKNVCSRSISIEYGQLEMCFNSGKAMNPFSPDCCHVAGLVWPGCAGLKLVPEAR